MRLGSRYLSINSQVMSLSPLTSEVYSYVRSLLWIQSKTSGNVCLWSKLITPFSFLLFCFGKSKYCIMRVLQEEGIHSLHL